MPAGNLVLGRQPVVDRHHDDAREARELAAHPVVRFDRAEHEAAPVKPDEARCAVAVASARRRVDCARPRARRPRARCGRWRSRRGCPRCRARARSASRGPCGPPQCPRRADQAAGRRASTRARPAIASRARTLRRSRGERPRGDGAWPSASWRIASAAERSKGAETHAGHYAPLSHELARAPPRGDASTSHLLRGRGARAHSAGAHPPQGAVGHHCVDPRPGLHARPRVRCSFSSSAATGCAFRRSASASSTPSVRAQVAASRGRCPRRTAPRA